MPMSGRLAIALLEGLGIWPQTRTAAQWNGYKQGLADGCAGVTRLTCRGGATNGGVTVTPDSKERLPIAGRNSRGPKPGPR